MPLRVMQVYLPHDTNGDLDEFLEGHTVLSRWRDADGKQSVLHLLLPAEETEPVMDRFEKQFAHLAGFHVVLYPVEAALPRPEEPAEAVKEEPAGEAENKPQRISREELYSQAHENIGIHRIFFSLTVLSAVVAAVGLIRNDVAVIIGAMVIAPLLGPNVAMSLAATLGDTQLLRRALATNLFGVVTTFVFAVAIGLIFSIDPKVPAIASRITVGYGDLILAFAAGTAGALAYTRGQAGAVIGVMVAVALLPPLVVCGMLVGAGHLGEAYGAFLLTVCNVACVNLSGVLTFIVQGVRPNKWREAIIAKKETRRAMLIWALVLVVLVVVLWLSKAGEKM